MIATVNTVERRSGSGSAGVLSFLPGRLGTTLQWRSAVPDPVPEHVMSWTWCRDPCRMRTNGAGSVARAPRA